ncbi:unnamed protein product [Paramecium pentaurelia]|uniref:Uncharacterized protein n=1 Tax=Paramecium pentaurelia TaxID=43138 RepID=A0A8S1SSR1_9CILI|nr:unnamed protein product [Paramecium pentaurelia]
MVESCIWKDLKCQQFILQPSQNCIGLNKFGCLNAYQPCVWSGKYNKCESPKFSENPQSCILFLSNQSEISHMNAQTCTQININQSCILGKNYKCRQITESQLYDCQTQGLNYNACLLKTKNNCAFLNNKCITIQNVNEGCKDYLNKNSCLIQDAVCQFNDRDCINQNVNCKFTDRLCSDLKVSSINQISAHSPYSIKTCSVFDREGIGLIYGPNQNKCIQVAKLNKKLKDCNLIGINKYACLYEVENYCQYDGQCKYIQPSFIKECLNTLNVHACTQIENLRCKFLHQCMPALKDDNCESIATNEFKVNKKICQMDQKNSCGYDSIKKTCKLIGEIKQNSCKNLNLMPCIFNTQDSLCEFDEVKKQCQNSFGNSMCTDKVNKNKCLAIITKGQYCEFIDNKGCQAIANHTEIKKCIKSFQTNPNTCSQSIDIPCFYDKETKMCIEYSNYKFLDSMNNQGNNDMSFLNYGIQNVISLNQKACEIFDYVIYLQNSQKITKKILLQWSEGRCMEIKGIDSLWKLNCDQNLNKHLCNNIRTKNKYCQYQNQQCKQANLKDYQDRVCNSIEDVNSGVFCAQTTKDNVPCYYDSANFKCQEVPKNSNNNYDDIKIECVEKDPEQKGYNKFACELDKENCIFKEQCIKITKSDQKQFCSDAKNTNDCPKVILEGCMIQNNECVKIQNTDYNHIKCEQVQNLKGCTNIQTEGQYCQFIGGECKQQDLITKRNIICEDIKDVNNEEFCQQPKDKGCIFDYAENNCKVVSNIQNLTCSRGINRIACLQFTNKDQKCSYLDYCFGPNQMNENCSENCMIANSIETCLNQRYCKCQWQDYLCQIYTKNSTQCEEIKYSSLAVCNSIENCFLDTKEFICKSIEPTSCDQLQSPSQCSSILSLPCIWYEEEQQCMYLETQDDKDGYISMISSAQINCEDITYYNGSQRACMNIERQGQMCIYKDNQCTAFVQDETKNNCLDNININSCLQQKISDCYWNIQLFKVKKTIQNDESEEEYGNCIEINQIKDQKIENCDTGFSYTSCLNIAKEGVFCKWNNQQCQIIDDKEQIIFHPSQLIDVNSNACGLINNGNIVKYDKNMRFCIKVDDVQTLSCHTEGLNKEACLNIKFQNCFWDPTRRKCRYQQLLTNYKSCKLQNLSSYLCSQLKLDLPCGFMKDGCDFVDLDQVKCTYEGLNKYACLNIKKHPCIWLKNSNNENYHCEDYLQYLPCDQIPSNVNSKVCSIVKEGACYYDQQNLKCEIPNEDQKSCSLTGLNIIGCVKIENCFFDQNCQLLNKQQYICEEFPIANKLICKNAVDSCKYNEFQYGCSRAFDEFCYNDSLSEQGCLSQPKCVLQEQRCQCRKFVEIYDCTQIQEMDKCKLKSHCKVQQQENQQSLQCILKQCQDYSSDECEGKSILKSICYWSSSNKCMSAQKCDDIVEPMFECSQYEFNDRPCQKKKNSENCEQFNCENFSKELCLAYKQYCNFDQTCQKKQCNQYLIMESCIINNCHWDSKEKTCSEQIHCSKIYDEIECNKYKYNSTPCQWMVNEDNKYCTQYRCSDLSKLQQCSGSRIGSEFCVEISDSICISCEEIFDSCDCLQQSKYCSYDIKKDKCTSKNCESYLTKEECPISYCTFIEQVEQSNILKCLIQCQFRNNYDSCNDMNYQCEWREENQKCQTKCEYIFDEEMCSQVDQCSWNYQEDKCQIKQEGPDVVDPQDKKEIIITGLITLCISLI